MFCGISLTFRRTEFTFAVVASIVPAFFKRVTLVHKVGKSLCLLIFICAFMSMEMTKEVQYLLEDWYNDLFSSPIYAGHILLSMLPHKLGSEN